MNTPITRRSALQLSAGLGLSFLMPGMSYGDSQRSGPTRKKSLIVLWMAGGPSQLETWDPHPEHKNGGPTRAIKSSIPGVQISSELPQMADELRHMSVVRSLVSQEGDHERGSYYLKTGHRPDPTLVHPSVSAITTHEIPDQQIEIPMHVSLGNGQWPARGGELGNQYDAYRIFEPGKGVRNMKAGVTEHRHTRRLEGLKVFSQHFNKKAPIRSSRTMHQETIESALTMMRSDQLEAFELEGESKKTLAAYGDTKFGRGCLVARRLIQTGVRAVEVTLTGFDSHAKNFKAHTKNNDILDPAFATLIRDLKERGLFDSTVVLCIGEFGRTPRINPLDGRDHWPAGFSCVLGGGGLRSGVVIGETDPSKTDPKKTVPHDPIKVEDLYATVLHTLGIDPTEEYVTASERPMAYSYGTPIKRLI